MGKGNRNLQWNQLFDEEQDETLNARARGQMRTPLKNGKGIEEDEELDLEHQQMEEVLQLQGSDHPGMQLVTSQLTGSNFFNWSRSVKRALGAKSKLEMLDGTIKEPKPDSKYYKRWMKVDYMISSWIVNSISKELVDSFSHYGTSEKLWKTLCRRFDRSNGAKITKLEKDIRNYTHGNQSVIEYFNNLTKLWNEMDVVMPPICCTCIARAALSRREEDKRLVQFLLGLNECFENTRSQILLMDHLPTVDRAYAVVTQVEDEKSMNDMVVDTGVQMAMYTHRQVNGYKGQGYTGGNQTNTYGDRNRLGDRRMTKEEKRRLKCTHCRESGHEAQDCFKLHGYPE